MARKLVKNQIFSQVDRAPVLARSALARLSPPARQSNRNSAPAIVHIALCRHFEIISCSTKFLVIRSDPIQHGTTNNADGE